MLLPDLGPNAVYHNRMACREGNGAKGTGEVTGARVIVGLALAAALAGCGSARLFSGVPAPESPDVAEAPWPRLVDTPQAPPPGSYTEDVPDPAMGAAAVAELGEAARAARARAEALTPPVLSEAERRRLGGAR